MRILKFAALGLCGIIVLVLVRGLFMPSTWNVERSILIQAEPATIQALVGDLRRWPEWMAWSKERDSSAEYTFSGEGVGAVMSWTGKKLGKCRLTLTAIDPPRGVGYELWLAGRDDPGQGTLRLEADARASSTAAGRSPAAMTKVVWHETGDVGWNPMYRLILPLIEPALGRDFTLGLERLKLKAESGRG